MKHQITLTVTLGILLVSCAFSVGMGAVYIPPESVLDVLTQDIWATNTPLGSKNKVIETIVWEIRLPRIILAILVGAALAGAGGVMQGFFQNPMADPYIMGISAGAALGATLAITLNMEFWIFGLNAVSIAAFFGALSVTLLVYTLARRRGRVASTTLLLTGIAIGAIGTSVTSYMLIMGGENQRQLLFWLMGSLSARRWDHVWMLLPYATVGLGIILIYARELNVLLLGDEQAAQLGVHVEKVKLILLTASACLAAAAVSVSGIIGFVGLLAPHMVRLIVGPDYRIFTPMAALGGAILLVWADLIARTALAPAEIPIGILTTVLGAPFFLYLLHRQRKV